MKLVLEPRYLFDGAAAATAAHSFSDSHHHHADGSDAWGGGEHADNHVASLPTPPAIGEPSVGRTGSPETVLFVDPRVADWQQLVAGVKRGVDVVVLDPNQDGISQVTAALAGLTNVKNVEFLTDGTPGSITLGGTTLDAAVLGARANEITGWSGHLAANADIVFWGCDVGQGSVGTTFVSDVHTLTGATVGASSDPTGAAALGGDWTLEVSTGPLHRDLNPFTKDTLAHYDGVLDTPIPTVALQVTDNGLTESGTLNLGDTLTTTIALENTAQAATGYSPYVEVWVPTGLTLSGAAKENGTTLVDVTAAVSGGTAINPLTHQSELAPDGITSGTLYVFELPSSVAPGVLVGPVVASFTMSNDSSLLGQSLTIAARGGFLNGAVNGAGDNIEGETFSSTAKVVLDPSVGVVGASNNTGALGTAVDPSSGNTVLFDPTGTSSGTAVSVTPGEIVRLRMTDQLAAGTNDNVSFTMTLPTGLTYTNDSTATVLLVSSDGSVTTSLTGSSLQLTDSSPNTAKLDLGTGADTSDVVQAGLSASDISYNSGTNQITFNLGTMTHAAGAFYVLVEFNAAVGSTQAGGTGLTATMNIPSGTSTTATETVSTGYSDTNFTTVLNLPLFDTTLGTLDSATLTLVGNLVSSGTITATANISSLKYATSASITLQQAVGGPALPGGSVSLNPVTQQPQLGSITTGNSVNFDPSPGGSTSNPATATSGALTYTTGLSGLEASGGGTAPVEVVAAAFADFKETGGNFSSNLTTKAEGVVSISYTYARAASTDNVYLTVDAPTVTLTKAITGISYTGTTATVTYVDTIANTSSLAPAYELTLTDVGDGNTSDTITDLNSHSGTGTSPSSSVTGGNFVATLGSLPANGTETFSYTETVPIADVAPSVPDSKTALATVTSSDLNPALFVPVTTGNEQLAGSTETPSTYSVTAKAPFDSISGKVNQDTGTTIGDLSPLVALSGETVTVSYTGQIGTESQQTDSSGNFTLLVPDALGSVTLTAAVGGTLSTAVLDNHPSETGTPSPLPLSSTATETGFEASNTGAFSFTPVSGSSYSGIVFDFWKATAANSTPTATLSVVGSSNNTAGLGTLFDPNGQSSPGVLMTDGEIVRERATLDLTTGTANSSSITVTLPTGLTMDPNYATDGSVTVLLVSADGTVTTSLTGAALQLAAASPNATKLDLGTGADTTDPVTTALPVGDINVSGSTVTFNLGNLKDTSGSYSAIVEFNAIVSASATTGTVLNTQMSAGVGALVTATQNDYVNTQTPAVTLAKAITGISYSGTTATVTYVDTVSNSSGVTAFGLSLSDTGDGNTSDTQTPGTASGTGTGVSSITASGGTVSATMTSLASGSSETFSYTETIPTADVAGSVADSKTAQAQINWRALTNSTEALAGTSVTAATSHQVAVAPFDLVSGNVNQDLSPTEGTDTPLQGLPSQTVAVTFTGQTGTESVSTASDGSFAVLVPTGDGSVSIQSTASTPNAPSTDVLDNHPDTATSLTGTTPSTIGYHSNPAVLTFTPTAGNSYTGLAFDYWAASTPTAALSIVGSSNDTAGLGTLFDPNGQTSPGVLMTDGEIVRERATLNLTAGSAGSASMTVTLPSNLTFDSANDGSVTVLLVSTDGNVNTTLSGTGLQLTDASPNAAKLDLGTGADTTDPVTVTLPSGDISYNSTTHTATFNLGNLSDPSGSYSAIVEFNAVVSPTAATGTANALNTQMTGTANSTTTTTQNDYVNTQAPSVTLTKAITGISYSGTTATVSYVDTVSNSSGVTAYGLSLSDTGDGNTSDTQTPGSASGTGTGVSTITATGGTVSATMASLASGSSETFRYTETIPVADVAGSVADSKTAQAQINWRALTNSTETLVNTSVTATVSDVTAIAPLSVVSGTVNQDTATTFGGGVGTPADLTSLSGQTVALTFAGQSGTETTTTDSSGDFSLLAPSNDAVTITVTPTSPHAPVPAAEQMDNTPSTTGTPTLPSATDNHTTQGTPGPGTLTFTPAAGTSYSGATFDFWSTPDTAPVLANGPSSPVTFISGGSGIGLFPAGTVADTQLDNSFSHDFSGTTLTMERYVSGVATPNANDSFTGSGTSTTGVFLNTTNHEVFVNGTEVGTFTETGGKLSITFLSTGVTNTTVDTVWQGINYSYTGTLTSTITGVVIGTQIDDANNDPISLNGASLDPSGPHDQGVGGDLLSNVLTATLTLLPQSTATPELSVVGSSNDTAGLGTLFDPNGQTSPGVAMTDGEIVRERATLDLTDGQSSNTSMTVTLPSNLTFDSANDGSVTVLLVSADGAVTTSLTGAGLQLTAASPDATKLDLGNSPDTTDPVTTVLPSSDVSVSGSTVTFNLGTMSDATGPYHVIVEFNAVVSPSAPTGSANTLQTQMSGSANSVTTSTVSDYVDPQAPNVTLTKAITGISYSGSTATVSYVDTVSNSSGVTAYGLSLSDTGDGNTSDTQTAGSASGTGTGVSAITATGGTVSATMTSLASGSSETFSYTETIPVADVAASVADSKTAQAQINWRALTNSTETLVNTAVTATVSNHVATAPLVAISGTVNQDTGPTEGGLTPLVPLSGETVSLTYPGQTGTESVTTDSSGDFAMLAPGGVTVSVTPTVTTPLVLDNHPDTTGTPTLPSGSTTGFEASNAPVLTFTPASGTSYSGVNFDFWAASTPTPTLSVVGSSNDTAGLGTLFDPNGQTRPGVAMTDGEIVRERATLNLTAGSSDNTTMTVTLPSNLAFDAANDGSVTVLLVSSDGAVTTTLTGAGLQLADASPNAAKLDLGTGADTSDVVTTALASGDVNATGNTVTFSLGNLNHISGAYQVIVEFNAVVSPTAPTGAPGDVLNTQMVGSVNGTSTSTVSDYVDPQAPSVSLTKEISGFSTTGSTTTVTYVDTVTSTTNVSAYGLTITDVGDGNTSDTITDLNAHAGNGTGISSSVTGGNFVATLASLPGNGSESFTYTETIPTANLATSQADSVTAQGEVVWRALTTSSQTLVNTIVTASTANKEAVAPFGLVSGTVNQDNSPTEGGLTPLAPLPNETVVISFPGGSETVQTDSTGAFTALIPTGVAVSITPTVPDTLVLDNHPETTGTPSLPSASTSGLSNSPTLTFTPGKGDSYTDVTFDFWKSTVQVPIANTVTPALTIPEIPLIPQLALIGSVENRFIIEDQQTVIQVPPDIFIDSDPNAELVYDAKLPDGTPLPSWLHFDANNLTFDGTPPLFSRGRIEITITAKDQYGNTAEASFSILIGQKQEDLSKLLLQSNLEPGTFRPYGFQFGFQVGDATPVPPKGGDAVQIAKLATPHLREALHGADAWQALPQLSRAADVGGFSTALRKASHIGVLSRARALLDGLDKLPPARPSI